jgi:AbrB family looped-hinge helix DNA binding protein
MGTLAMQAVIDEAGQVTIPKDVRERLGLAPGNVVDFIVDDGSAVIRKVQPERVLEPDRFERLRGSLNLGMTTDEFMAILRGED